MNKQELRQQLKEKRSKLSKQEVNNLSSIIINKLTHYINNKITLDTYFVYNNFQNEVVTTDFINYLLSNNKKVYLPKINNNLMNAIPYLKDTQMKLNHFKIYEPIGENINIDNFICITPLLGVDTKGNRIGFGKGYYDQFLKDKTCIKIGICYDFQILNNEIETNIHDIPLDIIISEKQIIEIKKRN